MQIIIDSLVYFNYEHSIKLANFTAEEKCERI